MHGGETAVAARATPRRPYLSGLDGLRGIAVLAILAYHLGFGWAEGLFWSVDLFFVLSGFLITGLLLDRTPGSTREMGRWWARRIRRLTPAVAVVVLAVLVAFSDVRGIVVDALATMTWWENWRQIFSGVTYWSPDPSPLRHAWSLSIEEQFYLSWPLILLAAVALARRLGRSHTTVVGVVATTLAAASASWAAYLALSGAELNRIYLGTDTRASALLVGCAAGAFLHGRPSGPAARSLNASDALNATAALSVLGLVGLSIVLRVDATTTYTGGLALATLACVALVITASRPGPVADLLSRPGLRWIGIRSYGIYLWSWPIQMFVEARLPDAPRLLVAALTVPTAFLAAWGSLALIEHPMRGNSGWAERIRPRRVAWLGGTAVVVAGMVLVAANATPRAVHEEVSATEAVDLALAPAEAPPATTTTTAPTTTLAPAPSIPSDLPMADTAVLPATTEAPPPPPPPPPPPLPPMRVMVAGDSLGFTAAYPEPTRSELPGFIRSVSMRAVIGCGVLASAGYTPMDTAGEGAGAFDCSRQGEAESLGLSSRPDRMVFFSGGWEHIGWIAPDGTVLGARSPEIRQALINELVARANKAAQAGVPTAFVAWICPTGVAPSRTGDYSRWYNDILRSASAQVPGSFVIEPTPRLCVDGDAGGAPTPEKAAAFVDHHPNDKRWVWSEWIGPEINGRR